MCAAVKTSRLGKFDLNPRGNLWVKDENKFGQKLLSKMGWSQGKGLGKNENGITESLKVRMKLGNSGVGWSEKVPLGLESQEYNAVLENLNKKFEVTDGAKSEKNLKGLEQRSQQFKNRLHYQKFIKGKDVCRYSEKDMNSIFITRKTNTEPEPVPVKSSVTNVDNCPTEDSAPDSVPMFKSQLSMKDYFAMKLKKKSGDPQNTNMEESQNVDELSTGNEASSRKRKKELKKSKKSKKIKLEQPNVLDGMDTSPAEDVSVIVNEEELSDGEIPAENIKEKKLPSTKSKKTKLNNLEKLKSCLKIKTGSSTKYWFKQEQKEVSFNDSVSYKIIYDDENDAESDFTNNETSELDTSLSCLEDNIYSDEEFIQSEKSNQMEENNCAINELNGRESEGCEDSVQNSTPLQDLVEEEEEEEEEDNLERPECLNLPKCEKSNYNTWLESQKIAIKMKLYKNMVKKIRKHRVLRTSNLLDIKGYGNWGF